MGSSAIYLTELARALPLVRGIHDPLELEG
jgi:hypothetical protein